MLKFHPMSRGTSRIGPPGRVKDVSRSARRWSGLLVAAGLLLGTSQPGSAQTETGVTGPELAPAFIVERYEGKADTGDARAMFNLGFLHERGAITGTPDLTLAADWYAKAAAAGHASAQFKRASMYAGGIGGPRDDAKAAVLYEAAAQQGMAEAQFNLALMLQNGTGLEKDIDAAIRWYEQAAFRGILPAMRSLGLLYLAGVGQSPQDDIEAWAWLTLAVESGDNALAAQLSTVDQRLDAAARTEALQLVDAYRQLRLTP